MAHKKRKKLSEQEIFLKAFKKANREIEMERNDGNMGSGNYSHREKQ